MTENAIHYVKKEHLASIIFNAGGGPELAPELSEICAAVNGR